MPDKSDFKNFFIDLASGGTAAAISKTAVASIERVKLLLQVEDAFSTIAVPLEDLRQLRAVTDIGARWAPASNTFELVITRNFLEKELVPVQKNIFTLLRFLS
ncbi:hypothetical protein Q1695_005751 [Nippostrongylus brasiliensis]|nr:hypothetical protein Q1695_005751 [Nippostrongylus brasiliensis]